MSRFDYLLKKIEQAVFLNDPFKHISISNFFNEGDFRTIINHNLIRRKDYDSSREMINDLTEDGYEPLPFPGCITSVEDYLEYLDNPKSFNRSFIEGYGKEIIEGYGITLRLKRYSDPFILELMDFFNSDKFLNCIKNKFDVTEKVQVETAIQKNLRGYEISPHCDTKRKALTYMINIYDKYEFEKLSVHTQLMRFVPEYSYLYEFWKHNPTVDTCWVPWEWCEKVKETNINNSIIIFRPSYDTLHSVKLDYDHLRGQRNQIYGNLWYPVSPHKLTGDYKQIDILGSLKSKQMTEEKVPRESQRSLAERAITKIARALRNT